MRYFVISDSYDTVIGMRLAGCDGAVVSTRAEVEHLLRESMRDPDIGMVLITRELAAHVPELVYELKLKSRQTLLVEIPSRSSKGGEQDSITRYIEEAIGVKL